ncbi:MAG: PKD domain-containing protein, partial [Chitinophagales bacterium]|nr:PKD domain-containing protein [Chitinophagales bacterium]
MQNIKNILVWLLLFTTMQSIVAQKYFEKNIGWEKWHNASKILERPNGSYIITGSVSNGNVWHSYSLLLDSVGNTYQINDYFFNSYYTGSNITELIKTANGYTVAGYINDTMSTSNLYYLQLSENGIITDSLFIGTDSTVNVGYALCNTFDGGYFAGGSYHTLNNYMQPYLVKIDSNNNVQEELVYTQYAEPGINFFTAIYPIQNQFSYYAIGRYKSNNFVGKVLLAQLDTNGLVIRDTLYSFSDRDVAIQLAELPDGGSLIIGQSTDTDNIKHGLILKLYPDWTVAWYNPNHFYDGSAGGCFVAADGNYIIAGYREYIYPPMPFDYDGEIVKLNPDGSLRWKRIFGGEGDDYIYDAIEGADGSIIVCGRTESNIADGGANAWILKLNCMGLLTEPQAAFSATMDTAALTASFQNLSQFVYPDSTDGGHFIWDFGDGTAPQIDNAAFVSHTFPAYGTYTVRLTAVVCSDTSVVEQVVGVFPVGLPQMGMGGFSVYPNPAHNQATLNYQFGDIHSGTLVITDIQGRLIKQANLQGNGRYVLSTQD